MQPLLRRLLDRIAQKVDRSAAGTAVPAGIDPAEQHGPSAHERTLMRRRLRALRRRRAGLSGHAQEVEALDAEARALSDALERRATLDDLLASGAFARCASCGELVAPRDRSCLGCGAQLPQAHRPDAHPAVRAHQPATVTGASSGRPTTPPAR